MLALLVGTLVASSMSVISASSLCVTCGMLSEARCRCGRQLNIRREAEVPFMRDRRDADNGGGLECAAGLSDLAAGLQGIRLQLLREIVPAASLFAVV